MKTAGASTATSIPLNSVVRWWDNGWRHGILRTIKGKFGRVEYVRAIKRIPLSELEATDFSLVKR